jgi:hypothetical protein
MEAEVRSILVDAARQPGTEYGLGDRIPERRQDRPRVAEFDL